MALSITQKTRKNIIHRIVSRKLSGGWRTPAAAMEQRRRDNDFLERVQVSTPYRTEPLELCFKQRFTVTPGSVSRNDMTGTWVWPTATKMLKRLCVDLNDLRRQDKPLKILELGSGCGLLGIALAATGDEVVLTDHEGNMDWLCDNIELNRTVVGRRAKTAVLGWGDQDNMTAIESAFGRGTFDAIVGSDLIYDPKCHHALTETMRRFARPSRSLVFLGYPDRGSNEPDFFCLAKDYFDIEKSPMDSAENKMMYSVFRLRP